MVRIVRPTDTIVPELLSELNNNSFLHRCESEGIVVDSAVYSLMAKFPNAKDYILRKYIQSYDPVDIDKVHVGNHEGKFDILRMTMSDDGHAQVFLRGKPIDLCTHVLVYGNPGVGKTSFVHRLKQWFDVIEVNASDTRTLAQLVGILTGAGKMTSMSREQIVLFDEMDNMAKSGKDFLMELVGPTKVEYEQTITESNQQPTIPLKKLLIRSSKRSRLHIVMLCNHIERVDIRLTSNDRIKVIPFSSPSTAEIETLLQLYAMKYWDDPDEQEFDERLLPSQTRITEIASQCNGDVRVALNMIIGGEAYEADVDVRPMDYTMALFTATNRDDLFESLTNDDISPTTICSYLSYNIVKYYDTASEIQRAFDVVSQAESLKFKTDAKYLWGVLVFGLPLSKHSTIRPAYPPRRDKNKQSDTQQGKPQKYQKSQQNDSRMNDSRSRSTQPVQTALTPSNKKRMIL